jgi:superkiller protein 3
MLIYIKTMKTKIYTMCLCAALLCGAVSCLPSGKKTIEREYQYDASNQDDQQTAQTIAATEMREILLRDAGEFLHPEVRSSNSKQAKKIEAATAGIVGMDVLDEKWDSATGRFYILARVVVDPHKVNKKIAAVLRDTPKMKLLEDSRQRVKEAKAKAKILRTEAELSNSPKAKQAYSQEVKKLAVEEYFVKGFNAQENGAYDQAMDYYQKAIELTPQDAIVYNKMGAAYAAKSDYTQAMIYFKKALEIDPNNAYAYNNLGNVYASIKEYTQAIYCFQKAILIAPYEAYAYNNLGNAYSSQHNYVNAIEQYMQAVKIDPSFAGAYSNMGTAYADLQNYNQAIDCYNKAISLDPGFSDAYNNLGYANYELKNYEQALTYFKKAISISPHFAEAYSNIGLVYGEQGKTQLKVEYCTKAAKLGDLNARKWLQNNGHKW